MNPVPTSGPRLVLILGAALVAALLAAPAVAQSEINVPADAPTPAEGAITRVFTISANGEAPDGTAIPCPDGSPGPCFDTTSLIANPGDTVVIWGDFRFSTMPHNIHITKGVEGSPKSGTPANELKAVSFVMPEEGNVEFVCDAHAQTMVGHVYTPAQAAAAGGGHGPSIPSLGVNFLAYWVGVIAFAILFIFYGAAFFLFKYNETNATTDHWDRSETPAESKRLAPYAGLLAVALSVVLVAGVIYVAVWMG